MPKTSLRQESGPFSLDAASLITTPARSVPLGLGSSRCLAAEFTRVQWPNGQGGRGGCRRRECFSLTSISTVGLPKTTDHYPGPARLLPRSYCNHHYNRAAGMILNNWPSWLKYSFFIYEQINLCNEFLGTWARSELQNSLSIQSGFIALRYLGRSPDTRTIIPAGLLVHSFTFSWRGLSPVFI